MFTEALLVRAETSKWTRCPSAGEQQTHCGVKYCAAAKKERNRDNPNNMGPSLNNHTEWKKLARKICTA